MNEIIAKPIPAPIVIEARQFTRKLSLIETLLAAFHKERISYCHWKSNEHLDASMTADTDLDVLFDAKQKEQLEALLRNLGFKKFHSIKQKQYKDIEDFIGLDLPSGKVVHLHTHYRLTLGEPYLKSYQLDWEEGILNSRVWDETFGIYRSHPAFELILLYVREALKIRNRDLLKMYLQNKVQYSENMLSEYNWLKQRCDEKEIGELLKELVTDYRPICQLINGPFNRRELGKLSVLIKKEFRHYRQLSPINALVQRWYREVSVKLYKKSSGLLNRPIRSHRVNPRGGLIIAVVGADGSGKSTVIANLKNTFRTKLDVYKIYFGRGDGRISWPRKILLECKKILAPTTTKKQTVQSGTRVSGSKNGFIKNVYKCIEALMVANEKRKNLKQMQVAKNNGMLVICDRFPQNQVMGYNDGPLLHHLSASRNPVFRAIAKKEAGVYALAASNPPDVLFKLIADAKVVEARKPGELSLNRLEAKITGFKNLEMAEPCKVITVDATQPLERVLFEIKKEIWDSYL